MKFTLSPDAQRMCAGVGRTISGGVIGVLPPKLQRIVFARRKHVGKWGVGRRARDSSVAVGVDECGVRGPFLSVKMIDHFVYQVVIPPVIKFKRGISQIPPTPKFIAASGQTDAGSVRRPNVLIADQTTVPLTSAVRINGFLQHARGVDVEDVILELAISCWDLSYRCRNCSQWFLPSDNSQRFRWRLLSQGASRCERSPRVQRRRTMQEPIRSSAIAHLEYRPTRADSRGATHSPERWYLAAAKPDQYHWWLPMLKSWRLI